MTTPLLPMDPEELSSKVNPSSPETTAALSLSKGVDSPKTRLGETELTVNDHETVGVIFMAAFEMKKLGKLHLFKKLIIEVIDLVDLVTDGKHVDHPLTLAVNKINNESTTPFF